MGKKSKKPRTEEEREKNVTESSTDEEEISKKKEKLKSKKNEKREKRKEEEGSQPAGLPITSKCTISFAVAASIIDHCISLEQAANISYTLARVAVLFSVDEIVVYDDTPLRVGADTVSASSAFLAKTLQYLETPPYLRKQLFVPCPELEACDAFPGVQAAHHLSGTEWRPYREGVVLKSEEGKGSYVDIGLDRMCFIEDNLPEKQRVTVLVGPEASTEFFPAYSETMIKGKVVSSFEPKEKSGDVSAWGYRVRLARSLSKVIKQTALPGGKEGKKGPAYDVIIGTSVQGAETDPASLVLPRFRRLLLVFGGARGLDQALKADPDYSEKTPEDVFNMYLNTCPGPLSGQKVSMRTEEAVLVTLGFLQNTIYKYGGVQ